MRARMRIVEGMLGLLAAALALPAVAQQPALGAGHVHSLAVHADGSVRSWGSDSHGMLGIGRRMTYSASAARQVPVAATVATTSAGLAHVLALDTQGRVFAWGDNHDGQLGDGTRTTQALPMRPVGLPPVAQVSAGVDHSAAVDASGAVWAWGGNLAGQVGDGSRERRLAPVRIAGLPAARQVLASDRRTFVVGTDGSLWAWGRDGGMLGTGGQGPDATTPVRIAGLDGIVSIAASPTHVLALGSDGRVRAWGNNDAGALGNGGVLASATPALVQGIDGVVMVAAGLRFSIALRSDGTVRAWGANEQGFLGDGTLVNRMLPVAVVDLAGVTAVSALSTHTLAVRSDGSLWTWGIDLACELGTCFNTPETALQRRPIRIAALPAVASVSAGVAYSTAVTGAGAVHAWGLNSAGQLGVGVETFRATPVAVPGLASIRAVSGGRAHSIALRSNGRVVLWGNNFTGQLGDDSPLPSSEPLLLPGVAHLRDITAVSAGGSHNLALGSTGEVWAWGGNFGGQLGTPSPLPVRSTADRVPLGAAVAIAAGEAHSAAVLADGTVWTWGENALGQLGDGTFTARTQPAAVPGLTDVVAVSGRAFTVIALKRDGSVWGWGANDMGQAGHASLAHRATPARIEGLPAITAIAAGYAFSAALAADGSVWTWGSNLQAALGDGSTGARAAPRRVPGASDVVAISAGGAHLLALRRDGTLLTWGFNISGQLGDGTLATRPAPVMAVRENGAGTLEGNDWFLLLAPGAAVADRIPPLSVVATAAQAGIDALVRPRAADAGRQTNVYVFALAPATLVGGTAAMKASAALPGMYAKSGDGKDTPVACVLAQLNAAGQMIAVNSDNLQAFLSGVLGSEGAAVSILNGVPPSNAAGATFFVGYGPSGTAMINSGTNRGTATIDGALRCEPAAPQKGWWWNPAEDGRGYSVEVRGNNIFFASFLYDVSGRSTWLVSTGPTSLDGALYVGDLLSARGGQALGGAYPGFPTLRSEGRVTIAFNHAGAGTLVWPGGTVPMQRFNIVPGGLAMGTAADMPESGWWWNEQEAGRGFFMEWQGRTLDIAGYMYDEAGNPVWYLTVGEQSADGRTFTGTWWSYGNGMTLAGPWRQHARINDNVAPLSITFSGNDTATMTLPNGRTTALRRHRF